MKTCLLCGEAKSESEYHKNNRSRDGYIGRCKLCVNSASKLKRCLGIESRRYSRANRTEKRCSKCKEVKGIDSFSFHTKTLDKRESRCKSCRNLYNKNLGAPRKRERTVRLKSTLIASMGGACSDCGLIPSGAWPLDCFDFHHVSEKSFSISGWLQSTSLDAPDQLVMRELDKCIVLCANCHRKRHAASFIASE